MVKMTLLVKSKNFTNPAHLQIFIDPSLYGEMGCWQLGATVEL